MLTEFDCVFCSDPMPPEGGTGFRRKGPVLPAEHRCGLGVLLLGGGDVHIL